MHEMEKDTRCKLIKMQPSLETMFQYITIRYMGVIKKSSHLLTNPKYIIRFLIFLLMFLLHLNCNNSVAPIPTNKTIDTAKTFTHFLWPSNIGSYWIYSEYKFPGFGNSDKNWNFNGFNSFGVDFDTVSTNPTFYRAEITESIFITLNDTVYPSFVLNTGFKLPYYTGIDGVYNMGIYNQGDSLFQNGLFLPVQMELNKPWASQFVARSPSGFYAIPTVDKRLLSLNDTVTTPAGDFVCYVIRTRIIEADDYPGYIDFYEYFSPNVGLVAKIRIFFVPNEYWFLDYIRLLKEFDLNN